MRFVSFLSLLALAVEPFGSLAAPADTAALISESSQHDFVQKRTPRDTAVHEPASGDLRNEVAVATHHALEKRVQFAVSKVAKLRLVIASNAVISAVNWAFLFYMTEDSDGSVDIKYASIDKYSTPGSRIETQWKDTYNTPTEVFQRVVTFTFHGFYAGKSMVCTLTAAMRGSSDFCKVAYMVHEPTLTIDGQTKRVSSWTFDPLEV
ncbi:hypothetical protein WAI453_007392 [Rhynchosporium graminicola]|uniref:Secreted protein n=1 Tax=Rhynchosporium graminicola TaxID=2792576 RepID=A0A1E1LTL0_9HELO|nr:uncharacterized protein RCO7_11566 [Rhynchosporium commune]